MPSPDQLEKDKLGWNYSVPQSWNTLCKTGTRQSPIDIITDKVTETNNCVKSEYEMSYSNFHYSSHAMLYDGCFGEIVYEKAGKDIRYRSGAVWINKPSEHKIDGKEYAFEVQLLHSLKEEPHFPDDSIDH